MPSLVNADNVDLKITVIEIKFFLDLIKVAKLATAVASRCMPKIPPRDLPKIVTR